MIRKLNQNGN